MPYFTTEDNCKLYYELNGQGKAVVMIHGWDCCRHHFKRQLGFLRGRYQVLSYDLRGHGDSDRSEYGLTLPHFARDLQALIDHCELKQVSLAGWSMGTSIILEYVRQFGCERLANLCFIDMTPKLCTDPEWKLGLYGGYDPTAVLNDLHVMADDWETMVKAFVPALFSKEVYPEAREDLEWAYRTAMKNTPHVVINMWLAMAVKDYRSELKKITVPTLITYGGKSKLYAPEVADYMGANIPRSRVMEFEGCGHALHLEEPQRFNQALAELIG
jgi:pimeloyl-ACP methyl ester carboxylesterase